MEGAAPLQQMDLQFYAFFITVLCGAVLGLFFDLLRAARGYYRPNAWIGGAADLLFWVIAAGALTGALFFGNWGELRLYVLVGLVGGVSLYYWLASPLVLTLAYGFLRLLGWLWNGLVSLVLRLFWVPIVALAGLIWGALGILFGWLKRAGFATLSLIDGLFFLLLRPLRGPYRCCRLHYLRTKRRVKRFLRRWLLGDPRR
jgi:spore cortex biosynthesis protein YabQ